MVTIFIFDGFTLQSSHWSVSSVGRVSCYGGEFDLYTDHPFLRAKITKRNQAIYSMSICRYGIAQSQE